MISTDTFSCVFGESSLQPVSSLGPTVVAPAAAARRNKVRPNWRRSMAAEIVTSIGAGRPVLPPRFARYQRMPCRHQLGFALIAGWIYKPSTSSRAQRPSRPPALVKRVGHCSEVHTRKIVALSRATHKPYLCLDEDSQCSRCGGAAYHARAMGTPLDYGFVSSDSHVTEPPDCYAKHIDPAFRDRAPFIRRDEKKGDLYVIPGQTNMTVPMGLVAAGGRRVAPDDLQWS